ncbi:uncharacterized protein [Hyperolius riggenbachi]|uniref:uncharacterized protein n=1 Tax=Hyperolius riggenbachi TaxID=752182 RepID=UPI0035A2C184
MSSATQGIEAVTSYVPQRTALRKIKAKSKIYSNIIYSSVKQGHEGRSVYPSKDLLGSKDLLATIACEAARLRLYTKRRVLTRREIEAAMRSVLAKPSASSSTAV